MTRNTRRPTTHAATPICTNDPDMWHKTDRPSEGYARRACVNCPLITRCLDHAMRSETDSTGGRWGMFGGLTAGQRASLAIHENLHGPVDMDEARALLGEQTKTLLLKLAAQEGASLRTVVTGLAEQGVIVPEGVVRVALWWAGGDVPLYAEWAARVDAALLLRAQGESYMDIAAYLAADVDRLRAYCKKAMERQRAGLAVAA